MTYHHMYFFFLIPKNPKKKHRNFIHLKSSLKLPKKKKEEKIKRKSIIYTQRETVAPLLIHVVSIFEKPKKEKYEIYTQTII